MSRSISSEEFLNIDGGAAVILDIRRDSDYRSSGEIVPGSEWKDPAKIDEWISSTTKDAPVIIYCVRGGGVSNSVVDRLQGEGINARFIEGGIEGLKEAGGKTDQK